MYKDKSFSQSKDSSQPSAQPHGQSDDSLPISRDTAFAADLRQPVSRAQDTITSTPSPAHPTRAPQSDLSLAARALRFATTIVSSNNFYTSVGNVIITANLWTGVLLQPACALLAIANEAREKRRERGEYKNVPPRYEGIAQRAIDLWHSPGVYRVALSVTYFINSLESLAGRDLLFTAIYLCASLGNIGASRTLNRDYFRNLNKERGIEHAPDESRALSLVTSPGINWSITDILIGVMTLPKIGALGMAAAGVPTAFAVAALLTPLVIGTRAASSPFALICNCMSNLGFAAVHATWGNPAIAVACLGWGIASLIIARKQQEHLKS
jgi:hypothetical protein